MLCGCVRVWGFCPPVETRRSVDVTKINATFRNVRSLWSTCWAADNNVTASGSRQHDARITYQYKLKLLGIFNNAMYSCKARVSNFMPVGFIFCFYFRVTVIFLFSNSFEGAVKNTLLLFEILQTYIIEYTLLPVSRQLWWPKNYFYLLKYFGFPTTSFSK